MSRFDPIKRWWHSRGFGIHSPSAYRLVREVLCPSETYGYYAYGALGRLASTPEQYSQLSLLYRILVDLRPATVAISKPEPILATVVASALPAADINGDDSPDMAILTSGEMLGGDLPEAVFFCDGTSQLVDIYASTLTGGHVFRGPHSALIVRRADLPLQTFHLDI